MWLLLATAGQNVHAQVTAIRAGSLIDPETGTASRDQVILVEGGRIKAVGAGLAIPAGARVIDLSGSSVLPGLFDAHTHLCMTVDLRRDAGRYYYTTLNDPDSYRAIQGVANARSMLRSGFTTVRDLGNEGEFACDELLKAGRENIHYGATVIKLAGRRR